MRSSAVYKIAVNYAAVCIWVTLLLGGSFYYAINSELKRQDENRIAAELDRLTKENDRTRLIRRIEGEQANAGDGALFYALYDRTGTPIAGTLDMPRPGLDLRSARLADSRKIPARAGDLADGRRLVVARDNGRGADLDRVLMKVLAVAFMASLAISVIGALVLGRYLRGRLRPISTTANAIVAGDLSVRVPARLEGDEFDAVSRAVNLMLDRIAALMENLRQVSNDIAHDMRKPLIRLLCQTDRLGQIDDAADRVAQTGDELLALFASILRLAEVEGGDLECSFERIDLSKVVAEVAESFAPALTDAGDVLDWSVEPGIHVSGNRELLGQLAANLLDNARIHTPEDTVIRLHLAREGTVARLVVEDNGPGVPDADRGKLLQRFYRTDASRTTPGNGLGLSMVATTAHAHRGSIVIEDARPGLRIVVTLPSLDGGADRNPMTSSDAAGILGGLRRWLSGRGRS